jgi:hypothetical protein
MNDQQYRDYCLQLLSRFATLMDEQSRQTSSDDPFRELAGEFQQLAAATDLYDSGPLLVSKMFSSCPQLAPAFPRELLWFLGGECLHFMPDEELDQFQQLDVLRLEAAAKGEQMDYQQVRAKLLKLQ